MKTPTLIAAFAASATLLLSSCGSSDPEVVDLDKVLDTFVKTAELIPTPSADEITEASAEEKAQLQERKLDQFSKDFAKNLNEVPIMKDPVGIYMRNDGAFVAYGDANKNGLKDSAEKDIFSVEVDSMRNRLVASDLQNQFHRDQGYRMGGGGFLTGYLVGSMLSGQRRAGISPRRFSSMKMEPKGYHKSATRTVRSRRSSARSASGSRSFKGGK